MRAYFDTADGETIALSGLVSPEQQAVLHLMGAVGIRRIDDETIDEFVRRSDLYDTYIGGIELRNLTSGERVPITRQIITETMGKNKALWADVGLITPEAFDRMIRIAKAAR